MHFALNDAMKAREKKKNAEDHVFTRSIPPPRTPWPRLESAPTLGSRLSNNFRPDIGIPRFDPVLALMLLGPGPGEGETLMYSFMSKPGVLVGVLGNPDVREVSMPEDMSSEAFLRVGDANGSARLRVYVEEPDIEGECIGGKSCEVCDKEIVIR